MVPQPRAISVERLKESLKDALRLAESEGGSTEMLETLSASYGLALLLVDGHQPPALKVANNNSICQAFQSSQSHGHLCESHCGNAHQRVTDTGNAEHFRCHAGLHCFAVPLKTEGEKKLTVIGGRAFLQSSDYRKLVERLFAGDLKGTFDETLFKNLIFSNRGRLTELAEKLRSMSVNDFIELVRGQEIQELSVEYQKTEVEDHVSSTKSFSANNSQSKIAGEIEAENTLIEKNGILEFTELQSILSRLNPKDIEFDSRAHTETDVLSEAKRSFNIDSSIAAQSTTQNVQPTLWGVDETNDEAGLTSNEQVFSSAQSERFFFKEITQRSYLAFLKPLLDRFNFTSVSLLVRQANSFATVFLMGRFRHDPIHIQLDPWDERLMQAAKTGTSITLKSIQHKDNPPNKEQPQAKDSVIELFPMVFGGNVLGVLLIGQGLPEAEQRHEISTFCRETALQLEIIRLNAELERRSMIFRTLQNMAERVNTSEPSATYRSILDHSKELLNAERASLLLFDEQNNELEVKAATGPLADIVPIARLRLGEGVAGTVLEKGRPMLMKDSQMANRFSTYPERRYKTNSFISYPLIISGRKIGVLNLTDKADGGSYDEKDLKMIENIAPHIAMAIERAEWREKASEFELMSITDPLTGLLNRRYLEERVDEEVKRCQRNGFPMGFLMIDIDDFKYYNDQNGHPAGDLALVIVSQCIRSVLRSDDVAARYGGEEFSILLPLSSLDEATAIAERIRQKVETALFPYGYKQPLGKVTVSIGVATYSPILNAGTAIIAAADRALYVAKRRKKNCVQIPEELQPTIPLLDDVSDNAN